VNRARLSLFALVAVVGLALFWPHLFRPVGGDPSVYAYIGRAILRGDVPYRDAWDIKSPAIYFQYAAALGLFGDGDRAVNLAEFALVLATALIVARAAQRLAGAVAGLLAAIASLAAFHWFQAEGAYGQPETAAALLGGGALLLAMRPGPLGPYESLGAGGLAAALFWYKLPFALLALPMVARLPACVRAGTSGRSLVRAFAVFASFGLGVAGYFALERALPDFWQGAFVAPSRVATANPFSWRWHVGHLVEGTWMLGRGLPAVVLFAAVGAATLTRATRRDAWAVASHAGLAVALVALQANYFAYHWIPLLPSLCVLAGTGGATVARGLAPIMRSRSAPAVVIALLFVRINAAAIVALGEHLQRTTAPDETILPFDLAPAVDFYARRRRPSRFVYLWPLQHPRARRVRLAGGVQPGRAAESASVRHRVPQEHPRELRA